MEELSDVGLDVELIWRLSTFVPSVKIAELLSNSIYTCGRKISLISLTLTF